MQIGTKLIKFIKKSKNYCAKKELIVAFLNFRVDNTQSFQSEDNYKKEYVCCAHVKDPKTFSFVVLGNGINSIDSQENIPWLL